jgi:hypothetical protein
MIREIFKLIVGLILVTSLTMAQAKPPDRMNLLDAAVKRCEVISNQWKACDKVNAEGDNLACNKCCLKAYELEIARLTKEVRSTLPAGQLQSFDAAEKAWNRYFKAEKTHLQKLLDHLGTVAWIGLNSDLVGIAKARCEYLSQQFV